MGNRAYRVHIVATDEKGNEIKFDEIAAYPERAEDVSGCVREEEREQKAIRQVRQKMPHLRNVHAKGSIHV